MAIPDSLLHDLLQGVQKPGRYIGGETGAVSPGQKTAKLQMVLCFPDVYEIAMSNLGIRILYSAVNAQEELLCERAFAPWIDMEQQLRDRGIPLFSLESRRPLGAFDVVGFTVQNELAITNVVNMLRLAGIPVFCAARAGEGYPLVIGGGGGMTNPEPFAPFFDVIFLGEADHLIVPMLRRLAELPADRRQERLRALAELPGVYVPEWYRPEYYQGKFAAISAKPGVGSRPVRAIYGPLQPAGDVNALCANIKPVHDRLVIEVCRGCRQGCRFCQAGFSTRPLRQKTPAHVVAELAAVLRSRYAETVSLLALNIADYQGLNALLEAIVPFLAGRNISLSLPSLRATRLDEPLAALASSVRRSGFTIAPEASSQRLRDIINKNLCEQDILSAAAAAFEAGWDLLKLYFMVGLPFETIEDVSAISTLARRISHIGKQARRRAGRINLALSPFVPKAFTPFQWAPFAGVDYMDSAIAGIRRSVKERKIRVKPNDARSAHIEAILATGDRRLAQAIVKVCDQGERFSAWSDFFSYDRWLEALAGIDYPLRMCEQARAVDMPLPYAHLDMGVDHAFLAEQWRLAAAGKTSPACRPDTGSCTLCGTQRLYRPARVPRPGAVPQMQRDAHTYSGQVRLRLVYRKLGLVKYLGHHDSLERIKCALKTLNLPLRYSQGFNPQPIYHTPLPLPVGMAGLCEYADFELFTPYHMPVAALNDLLPKGMEVFHCYEVDARDIALKSINCFYLFLAHGPEAADAVARFCSRHHMAIRGRAPAGTTAVLSFPAKQPVSLRRVLNDQQQVLPGISLTRLLAGVETTCRRSHAAQGGKESAQ